MGSKKKCAVHFLEVKSGESQLNGRQRNIKDAMLFARATAGLSTTKIGTANSMPSREEIDRIL